MRAPDAEAYAAVGAPVVLFHGGEGSEAPAANPSKPPSMTRLELCTVYGGEVRYDVQGNGRDRTWPGSARSMVTKMVTVSRDVLLVSTSVMVRPEVPLVTSSASRGNLCARSRVRGHVRVRARGGACAVGIVRCEEREVNRGNERLVPGRVQLHVGCARRVCVCACALVAMCTCAVCVGTCPHRDSVGSKRQFQAEGAAHGLGRDDASAVGERNTASGGSVGRTGTSETHRVPLEDEIYPKLVSGRWLAAANASKSRTAVSSQRPARNSVL